jgi:hypothetical protein
LNVVCSETYHSLVQKYQKKSEIYFHISLLSLKNFKKCSSIFWQLSSKRHVINNCYTVFNVKFSVTGYRGCWDKEHRHCQGIIITPSEAALFKYVWTLILCRSLEGSLYLVWVGGLYRESLSPVPAISDTCINLELENYWRVTKERNKPNFITLYQLFR